MSDDPGAPACDPQTTNCGPETPPYLQDAPACDPSTATCLPPTVEQGKGKAKYNVTPQEKTDNGTSTQEGPPVCEQSSIAGCKDEAGQGQFTCDSSVRASVRESIYPGGGDEEVIRKYIYVVRQKKLVAEVFADSEASWNVWYNTQGGNPPPDDRPLDAQTEGYVQLDGGPCDKPHKYGFFLSPLRLTSGALDYLFKHSGEGRDSAVVTRALTEPTTVAVHDPFRWACDAQRLFFEPNLDTYEQWVHDEKRAAKLFVASVLKGWMQNGDPGKVHKMLKKGEPDHFLDDYRKSEKQQRERAEQASAYVAHCVQSPEHRVVEIAGYESQGDDLKVVFCQFGAVTGRATEVQPGREFIAALVADPERLPRRYIFTETPEERGFEFEDDRFSWLAALAVFEQVLPAWKRTAKFRALANVGAEDLIRHYLKNVKVESLTGKDITLWRNVQKGKSLNSGFGTSATAHRKFVQRVDKLLVVAAESREALADLRTFDKLESFEHAYEPYLKRFQLSVGTVFEVVNLALAINEFLEAKGDRSRQTWRLLEASADMGIHVLSCTQEYIVKRMGTIAAKEAAEHVFMGLTGALAFVSGMADTAIFSGQTGEAYAQHDYGEAVGKGISAVGAATLAIGGGLALSTAIGAELFEATLFTSAAFGPVGLIIGAIGSLLILGGCFVAWLFSHNDFQKYASLCCFGDDCPADDAVYYPWSSSALGYGNPVNDTKVLLDLLSQFSAERWDNWYGMDGKTTVHLKPGHITDASIFEVWVNRWVYTGLNVPAPEGKQVIVFNGKGEVLKPEEGDAPDWDIDVKRDAKGERVEEFTIKILPIDGKFPVENVYIRLNITGDGSRWTPTLGTLLKLKRTDGIRKIEATTMEKDCVVDLEDKETKD